MTYAHTIPGRTFLTMHVLRVRVMSVDTMGPDRRQCDNDDCEKIHEFCPLCEEKIVAHTHATDANSATDSLPDTRVDRFCSEWNDDELRIYWHEKR
jgi:hypothetical protein